MKQIERKNPLRSIFSGSLLFYGLSGLASLLNYAYYPVMSHLVNTSEYGEVQFLISLLTQLSVGYVVLNVLSIIITAKYQDEHLRSRTLQGLNTAASTVILMIIAVGSAVLSFSHGSFGFHSVLPIIIMSLSLLVNIPFTITIGRLQGEGRFALAGVMGASASFCELLLASVFVLAGGGTSGAIAGVGAGMLVIVIVANIVDRAGSANIQDSKVPRRSMQLYLSRLTHLRAERGRAVTTLVAIGALTILSTADVVISKFWLSPHEAGQYAAVATIAKTILYATTPLMWLSLPLAVANTSTANTQVRRFIKLTMGVATILALMFIPRPKVFTEGLLGIQAGSYTNLLRLSAVATALFALAFILLGVDLCRDKLRQTTLAALCAVATFGIGLAFLHNRGVMKGTILSQIIAAFTAIMISILGNARHGKTNITH